MASWWELALGLGMVVLAPRGRSRPSEPTDDDRDALAPLAAADPAFRLREFYEQARAVMDGLNQAIDARDVDSVRQIATLDFARRVDARLQRDEAALVSRQRRYQGEPSLSVVGVTPAMSSGELVGQDVVVLDVSFQAAEHEASDWDSRGGRGSPSVRPRREVWTLVRPTAGSGGTSGRTWRVAGVEPVGEVPATQARDHEWIWRPDPPVR